MARIVITASADADTAFILGDLAAKAGADVAARYDSDFDMLYRRLERFPECPSGDFLSHLSRLPAAERNRLKLLTLL